MQWSEMDAIVRQDHPSRDVLDAPVRQDVGIGRREFPDHGSAEHVKPVLRDRQSFGLLGIEKAARVVSDHVEAWDIGGIRL